MATSTKIWTLPAETLKPGKVVDIASYFPADPAEIEEIHLGGNLVGENASKALADFLKGATNLKVADFANIFSGSGQGSSFIPGALGQICGALTDKTSLVEIDLSNNAIGITAVENISDFLTKNSSYQILKLDNNGLGPEGGEAVAKALFGNTANRRKKGSELRTISCGKNRLQDAAETARLKESEESGESGNPGKPESMAWAWAAALRAHPNLVEVRMPHNSIGMQGIATLVEALSKNPNLEHLDLQDNTFLAYKDNGNRGLVALAEALPKWPKLKSFNLSDCFLSPEPEETEYAYLKKSTLSVFQALTDGSKSNLEILKLRRNNLFTEVYKLLNERIANALPNLLTLELGEHDIEDEDREIRTSIGHNIGGKVQPGVLVINDSYLEEKEEEEIIGKKQITKTADDKAAEDLVEKLGQISIK